MKQFTIEKLDTSILYTFERACSINKLLLAFGLLKAEKKRLSSHFLLVAALLCLLLLSALLLVAACGNYYQKPGSPPNATPTNGDTVSSISLFLNRHFPSFCSFSSFFNDSIIHS